MSTNEITTIQNEDTVIFGALPTMSMEDFQKKMFDRKPNRLSMASAKSGTTDTILHAGQALKSDDVVGHILTIIRVGFATLPETDMQGNPVFSQDENGVAIQRMVSYPICHFKEAPGYFYNGGTMLGKNVRAWAEEAGDNIEDNMLPETNKLLEEIGGVSVYFTWKDNKKGQRYVNMIVA